MPKTEPRICGLVRWHARRSDSCVRAININLSSELTRRFGRIQGIFAAPISIKQADAVVAHLEDAFTRGALEAARQRPPQTPQETLFEDAIAVTNKTVGRIFGDSGLGLDPRHATGAVMSVKDGDIVFAVWGTPELLLYRFPPGDGRTKVFNLLDGDEGAPKDRTGFTSVISGQLGPNDRLIAATRSVRDIIGPDKLERALRQHPSGAIEEMREALTEANDNAAVAVLVADVAESRYLEEEDGDVTDASVRRLEKTSAMTNEVLSPSLTKTVAAAAKVVATTAADAAVAGATAGREAIRQKQEAMRRAAEERARLAEEEAKRPKWLRPGDQVVGEREIEVGGQKFTIPVIEITHEEFDLDALAEEERSKTKTTWSATSKDEGGEEDPARIQITEDEPAAEVTEEDLACIIKFATAADEEQTPVTEAAPEDVPVPEPEASPAETPEPNTEPAPEPAPVPAPGPVVPKSPSKILAAIKKMTSGAVAVFRGKEVAKSPADAQDSPESKLHGLRFAWKDSSYPRKIAAVAVLVALVIGAAGIIANSLANRRETSNLAKERAIENVTQSLTDIEAALLYPNNEARAGEILAAALAMLEKHVPSNDAERETHDQLAQRLAEKAAVIRKEIPLGEPTSVSPAGVAAELTRLALGKGVAWLADGQGNVYRVKDGETKSQNAGQLPSKTTPAALTVAASGVLALSPDGKSLFVGDDGVAAAKKLVLDGETVTDAAIYADRLYVLDAAAGRITRRNPTENGWGEPQAYLKDGTNLKGSAAMVVDNYIYILRADGEITRLNKGVKDDFRAAPPVPALTSAKALRAPAGGDSLFTLDPATSRIVRWRRADGSLVAQYVAEGLRGASDFQVDVGAKTITVVNGDKILRYTLPQ